MDLDERAVKIVEEAEALSATDLRGALAKMREALAIEPDYPNLEDEIFIREDAISKLDGVLEFIVVLLREGKAYQACEMLQGLPDSYIIQDKSGLVGGLVEKLTKVQGLVEQARELAKSDCVKALSLSEEAFELVPDYPDLSGDVATLKQDVERYNSFIDAIEKALKEKDSEAATNFLANFREIYPDDENVSRLKVSIVNLGKNLNKKKDKKINLLKITAAVGSVLAIVAAFFAYEMFLVKTAGGQWDEVDRLLAAKNFTEAQSICLNINQDLGKVRLFFLASKQELQGKVNEVLQSELMVKGAEGKVLFAGEYIPKEQLAISQVVKKNIEEATALKSAGNYVEAIRKFENVLAAAGGLDAKSSAEVINDIKLSIRSCRLNIIEDLVAKAGDLVAKSSNDAALARVNEALTMVTQYSIDVNEPLVVKAFEIKQEIIQTKLAELLSIGEKLFSAGSYANAVKAYNNAYAFAKSNEIASDSLTRQIYGMINKSKIEIVISGGDKYMDSAKWQEAERAYESSIALAQKAGLPDLASLQRVKTNLRKAKKMQVVARLDQQNILAMEHFEANRRKKARNIFKQAIEDGEGSQWQKDSEMVAILDKLKNGLADLEEKIYVDAKKKFLVDRYVGILKKDFGLGDDATLLDPKVILLDATPKLLKFRLSAMSYAQKGAQGKYSRYGAVYAFDRKRESWSLVEKSAIAD